MRAIDRRTFVISVAATATVSARSLSGGSAPESGLVVVATWPFGKPAADRTAEVFRSGGSLLDAVEKGINVPEDDPSVTSVGYGGLPNADGEVELDAAIMDGTRHRAGAVCSLHSFKNPISVARQVMERTIHTTLAGEGAFRFALECGFRPQPLLTTESLRRWEAWKADPKKKSYWTQPPANHDTIGMVATDGQGHVVAGCSTSGMSWKIPGRVGDSPLIGCGVYADDNVGGASATGNGDLMTNYCTSISIYHYMRRGASAQEACVELLQDIARHDAKNKDDFVCLVALDHTGRVGAAAMNKTAKFQYAVWREGTSQLIEAPVVY